jgi:hypothetical protein
MGSPPTCPEHTGGFLQPSSTRPSQLLSIPSRQISRLPFLGSHLATCGEPHDGASQAAVQVHKPSPSVHTSFTQPSKLSSARLSHLSPLPIPLGQDVAELSAIAGHGWKQLA